MSVPSARVGEKPKGPKGRGKTQGNDPRGKPEERGRGAKYLSTLVEPRVVATLRVLTHKSDNNASTTKLATKNKPADYGDLRPSILNTYPLERLFDATASFP